MRCKLWGIWVNLKMRRPNTKRRYSGKHLIALGRVWKNYNDPLQNLAENIVENFRLPQGKYLIGIGFLKTNKYRTTNNYHITK